MAPMSRMQSSSLWQALVSECSRDLPKLGSPTAMQQSDQRTCVLLTGSTGSIGSYFLDSLLRNPNVYKNLLRQSLDRARNAPTKLAALCQGSLYSIELQLRHLPPKRSLRAEARSKHPSIRRHPHQRYPHSAQCLAL